MLDKCFIDYLHSQVLALPSLVGFAARELRPKNSYDCIVIIRSGSLQKVQVRVVYHRSAMPQETMPRGNLPGNISITRNSLRVPRVERSMRETGSDNCALKNEFRRFTASNLPVVGLVPEDPERGCRDFQNRRAARQGQGPARERQLRAELQIPIPHTNSSALHWAG